MLKHITHMSMLLNTALIGIFYAVFYICKPGVIYGRKSNFILIFQSLKGALGIKYIKLSNSRVISRFFGLQNNKIINENYSRPIYRESIKYSCLRSDGTYGTEFVWNF